MGLLDGDHQVGRRLAAPRQRRLDTVHVLLVDAARQQVRHEDVGAEVVAVTSELEDDVLPRFQVLHDAAHRVLGPFSGQEVECAEALDAPVDRRERSLVLDAAGELGQFVHAVRVEQGGAATCARGASPAARWPGPGSR